MSDPDPEKSKLMMECIDAMKKFPEESHYYTPFEIEYQADVYVTQGDDQLTAILARHFLVCPPTLWIERSNAAAT